MSSFTPCAMTFRGRLLAARPVQDVFPLFSPEGEKHWVPEWDPEFLYPGEARWEAGQIFRTREETGEAVWIVTRLDHRLHEVEYHRVEPGRYVARVRVSCRPVQDQGTEVLTAYSYFGLSESGNREIRAMTQPSYEAKMSRWAEWINRYLAGGSRDT